MKTGAGAGGRAGGGAVTSGRGEVWEKRTHPWQMKTKKKWAPSHRGVVREPSHTPSTVSRFLGQSETPHFMHLCIPCWCNHVFFWGGPCIYTKTRPYGRWLMYLEGIRGKPQGMAPSSLRAVPIVHCFTSEYSKNLPYTQTRESQRPSES